jgi:hypothetical protein
MNAARLGVYPPLGGLLNYLSGDLTGWYSDAVERQGYWCVVVGDVNYLPVVPGERQVTASYLDHAGLMSEILPARV